MDREDRKEKLRSSCELVGHTTSGLALQFPQKRHCGESECGTPMHASLLLRPSDPMLTKSTHRHLVLVIVYLISQLVIDVETCSYYMFSSSVP